MLRFRDLGASFLRFGCFVLRSSFSSASFSKLLEQFKVNLKLKLIKASFLLNLGDDFADPSQQAFKKPTKDSTPSRFTICTISSEFIFEIFIYVVVQFNPWFNLYFPLFWGMVMYGNEFKTKK